MWWGGCTPDRLPWPTSVASHPAIPCPDCSRLRPGLTTTSSILHSAHLDRSCLRPHPSLTHSLTHTHQLLWSNVLLATAPHALLTCHEDTPAAARILGPRAHSGSLSRKQSLAAILLRSPATRTPRQPRASSGPSPAAAALVPYP